MIDNHFHDAEGANAECERKEPPRTPARRRTSKNELSPRIERRRIASSKRCISACPSGTIRGGKEEYDCACLGEAIRIAQMQTACLDLLLLHERAGSSDPLTKRRIS